LFPHVTCIVSSTSLFLMAQLCTLVMCVQCLGSGFATIPHCALAQDLAQRVGCAQTLVAARALGRPHPALTSWGNQPHSSCELRKACLPLQTCALCQLLQHALVMCVQCLGGGFATVPHCALAQDLVQWVGCAQTLAAARALGRPHQALTSWGNQPHFSCELYKACLLLHTQL